MFLICPLFLFSMIILHNMGLVHLVLWCSILGYKLLEEHLNLDINQFSSIITCTVQERLLIRSTLNKEGKELKTFYQELEDHILKQKKFMSNFNICGS
jgi:hypothetical protein